MSSIIEDLLDEVSRPEFVARIGVVSSLSRFEETLAGEPLSGRLMAEAQADAKPLLQRIEMLLQAAPPESMAYSTDIPLAVLLRVVDITHPENAIPVARRMASDRRLWWSRFLARRVLGESGSNLVLAEYLVPTNRRVHAHAHAAAHTLSSERPLRLSNGMHVVVKTCSIAQHPLQSNYVVNLNHGLRMNTESK